MSVKLLEKKKKPSYQNGSAIKEVTLVGKGPSESQLSKTRGKDFDLSSSERKALTEAKYRDVKKDTPSARSKSQEAVKNALATSKANREKDEAAAKSARIAPSKRLLARN